MKCKDCSLCRGFWSFGERHNTNWGWKCHVINERVFYINADEAVLLGVPSPPLFESYKEHHREEDINVWRDILDMDCTATQNDIVQFVDEVREHLYNIDVKIKALLEDKRDLQDDIYQASLVLGEFNER